MAITGTLKVDPSKLISTAEAFQQRGNRIGTLTDQMVNIVQKFSASVWEGDARSMYAQKIQALQDDIQKIIKKINEHVTDLQEMATTYINAESDNVTKANSLSGDYVQ